MDVGIYTSTLQSTYIHSYGQTIVAESILIIEDLPGGYLPRYDTITIAGT